MPLFLPTRQSFVLSAGAAAGHSPADSTTYRFGNQPNSNPGTGDSAFSIIMTRPCVARVARGIFIVAGTLGSSESMTVRVRNTTGAGTTQDVTTALTGVAVANTFSNTALSLSYAAGDALAIEFVCPAWVTNPTTTFWTVTVDVDIVG